ncbi:MAG: enolase C-terminal domain-like protein [Rhabdochlamydiaceae bacterium]|nr:enolase C-terminal domain-like protein [Candidatus Amphrikana amoebophyrae]
MQIVKIKKENYLHKTKEGIHLTFYFSDGTIKRGDLSPLPGWSVENLAEAEKEFDLLCGLSLDDAIKKLKFPSSIFALQSSIESEPVFPYEICKLYLQPPKEIHNKVAKVKFSQYSPKQALNWFNSVPYKTKIRVDLNQSWSLDDLLYFSTRVNPNQIDYIEEPIKNLGNLPKLPVPIALDEHLREFPFKELTERVAFDVVVIKPTLQLDYISIIKEAKKLGKRIVLSSSYESELGLNQIKALALEYNLVEAHGLDT